MWVTPMIAALLGLLFFALCLRVISLRRQFQVALGDGGRPELLRAIRVQANFAEYVPLTLVLIALLEGRSAPDPLVWLLGLSLLLGRVLHAYGVGQEPEPFKLRISGMALTFFALVGASLGLLLCSLRYAQSGF